MNSHPQDRPRRQARRAAGPGLLQRTLLALAALAPLAPPAVAQALEVPKGYTLVWADEFDTPGGPDPARWVHDTARNKEGWHNNERQYYAGPRTANAEVRDGKLHIRARKETMPAAPDWGGQAYTSARLLTRGKAEWTYGFFEVSARMPCGKGTWPAIWMLGTGGRWPEDGELDIMEHVGHDPDRISSAVHVAAGHAGQAFSGGVPVKDACKRFHRYQMLWDAGGVTFGMDGFAHMRYPKTDLGPRAWPFDAPMYLLLNLAIGGDLGGPVDDRIFPVTMEVDYVRVYQAPKTSAKPGG